MHWGATFCSRVSNKDNDEASSRRRDGRKLPDSGFASRVAKKMRTEVPQTHAIPLTIRVGKEDYDVNPAAESKDIIFFQTRQEM